MAMAHRRRVRGGSPLLVLAAVLTLLADTAQAFSLPTSFLKPHHHKATTVSGDAWAWPVTARTPMPRSVRRLVAGSSAVDSTRERVSEATALPSHPGLRTGVLPNGLRYVLLQNAAPRGRFEAHLEVCAFRRVVGMVVLTCCSLRSF